MVKHLPLPVDAGHFDRWLALFEATAREICPPEAEAHFVERARRIAARPAGRACYSRPAKGFGVVKPALGAFVLVEDMPSLRGAQRRSNPVSTTSTGLLRLRSQ
jgi:hypothetical protein